MSSFKIISELTKPCSKTLSFSQQDGESIARTYLQFDELSLIADADVSTEALMKNLQEARRNEVRAHLNSVTLSNYWYHSRIPSGLRFDKSPTHGLDDPIFLEKWEQVLSKCSLDLMLLLIQRSNTEREQAVADITRIKMEIENRADPEVPSQLANIEKAIKAYQQDLMQFKLRKYRKHTMDYARGSIYNWNVRPRRQRTARSGGSRSRGSRRGFTDSEADSSDVAQSDREDHPSTSTSTETTVLQVPPHFPDGRDVARGGRVGRGRVRFDHQQPRRRSPRRGNWNQSAR